MPSLWLALGSAFCSFVPASGVTDPAALTIVGGTVLAALVRRRSRSLVCVALLLGALGGLRVQGPAVDVADPSALQPMHIELSGPVEEGRSNGWARLPGGPVVRARIRGISDPAAASGSRLLAVGRLQDLSRRPAPDRRDAGRGARARRQDVGIVVKEVLHLETPGGGESWVWVWRRSWSVALEERLGASAGLWRALVLAEGSALDDESRRRVVSLGMAHLLALSGMHTSVVAGAMLLPLRRYGRRALLVALPLLAAWVLLAGGGASLVRAVGMVAWWLIARLGRRRTDPADAVAAVALLELTLRPHLLCGIGWWLSYAATLGVVRAAQLTQGWFRPFAALGISASAQVMTLPWVLDAFGRVNVVAPFTLLLVGPVFALSLVGGLGALALGALLPLAGSWCDVITMLAGHLFGFSLHLVRWASGMTSPSPGIDGTQWVFALAGLAVAVWPAGISTLRRAACVSVLMAAAFAAGPRADHAWILFDVGQGDSAALRCGSDALVIDTGPRYEGRSPAAWTVVDWLERRRLTRVIVLLTHGHADHTGGLAELLATGRVESILVAAADSSRVWTRRVRDAAGSVGVGVQFVGTGDRIRVGHCGLEVMWPGQAATELHSNDRSIVVSWPGPGGRILSGGDLERVGEAALLEARKLDGHRWLKVSHHGGDTGTGAEWISALGVRSAFVSCGAGNRYGHPHPAVMSRLREAGVRVHRTDRCGFLRLQWSSNSGRAHVDCGRLRHP
jgi:competence protein ComEC